MKYNHPFSVVFNQNVVNRRLCRCVIGKIVFKQRGVYQ